MYQFVSPHLMSHVMPLTYKMRQKKTNRLVFHAVAIILILLFTRCGFDVEDPTPPNRPQWIPKSLPGEWPERGIDANEDGGIALEWMANSEDEYVREYQVLRAEYFEAADSIGEFYLIHLVDEQGIQEYKIVDETAQKNVQYFYRLRCIDHSGNRSAYSDSLNYKLHAPITLRSMLPNGLTDTLNQDRELSWRYVTSIAMENYTVTILDHSYNLRHRLQFQPGNYLGLREKYTIPNSLPLDSGQNYFWRIDVSSDYVDGIETAASESLWATFLYIN